MVLSWAITAIFALLLVNIPVSVGMWYAGDAARVFFQQVGTHKSMIAVLTKQFSIAASDGHEMMVCA